VLSLYQKTGELTEHLRNCIADCILSVEFAKDINTKYVFNIILLNIKL